MDVTPDRGKKRVAEHEPDSSRKSRKKYPDPVLDEAIKKVHSEICQECHSDEHIISYVTLFTQKVYYKLGQFIKQNPPSARQD
eukprot:gene975-1152_t